MSISGDPSDVLVDESIMAGEIQASRRMINLILSGQFQDRPGKLDNQSKFLAENLIVQWFCDAECGAV